MHVLLTGATGTVGRFLLPALAAAGHRVTTLGRRPATIPWDPRRPRAAPAAGRRPRPCRPRPRAPAPTAAARATTPPRFRRLNLDGTLRLFDAAGAARIVFLSSRAVYGDHRRGEFLHETDPAAPDSLYGEVKLAAEAALGPRGAALRATGVYGGARTSGQPLFAAYLARRAHRAARRHRGPRRRPRRRRPARSSTRAETGAFNVSDLLLDRHDLLARVQALTGCPHPPPPARRRPAPRRDGDLPPARPRLAPGGWPGSTLPGRHVATSPRRAYVTRLRPCHAAQPTSGLPPDLRQPADPVAVDRQRAPDAAAPPCGR